MTEEFKNRTEHIQTWSSIKSLFGRIFKQTEELYFFRGQADASWGLEPSLLRRYKRTGKDFDQQKMIDIEQEARNEFILQAHLHISDYVIGKTRDQWDWWGLMQQYGAPTPMLDWTKSPYVAAYFAANGHFDREGSIWYVSYGPLIEAMKNLMPTDRKVRPYFYITPTDRLVAQQSVATFSDDLTADQALILDELMPEDCNPLVFHRITFPANQKVTILKELRQMNISAASLFPGIDGLGLSIAELYDTRIVH